MASRIRHSPLTRLCGLKLRNTGFSGEQHILRRVRPFSSTRISGQASETAPTHAFSNGKNLGSISLKKNGIYLDNKLRIVSGVPVRL